jgi:hypothetical protein
MRVEWRVLLMWVRVLLIRGCIMCVEGFGIVGTES